MKQVRYEAVVDNPMSCLEDFPFDLDRLDLTWITTSSWETRDLSMKGVRVTQTAWRLNFIRKYGDLGQITKLQLLFQSKYQAEKIKSWLKPKHGLHDESETDGEIHDRDLTAAEKLPELNKEKLECEIGFPYSLKLVPAVDKRNPTYAYLWDKMHPQGPSYHETDNPDGRTQDYVNAVRCACPLAPANLPCPHKNSLWLVGLRFPCVTPALLKQELRERN